jgi:dihydrofolate synthase / folylpolyglutamate synthase
MIKKGLSAMNFDESLKYLYGLGHETLAMKLGLDATRSLAAACDNPQQKFPAVHIAGTNGKGSTAAMTTAILRAAGLRTGLYTSPHLVSITERITVDDATIAPDDFARLAGIVRTAGEKLVAAGALAAVPTFFEQVTMIAYLYFAERQVELAVLEVGLGGRLDATNICEPVVTAITPVGLDHEQYLGHTLVEIAGEKAGIIKPAIPVIVAPQEDEAMTAIITRATKLQAPLISIADEQRTAKLFQVGVAAQDDVEHAGCYRLRYQTPRGSYDARLSLRGKHQVTNALTAIHCAEQLQTAGWPITPAAINQGLQAAHWPGRLELIKLADTAAPLLLDGAHNPQAARVLRAFLAEHFPNRPLTIIFGAMKDKAIAAMTETLFPLAQQIILTQVANPRAAAPQTIAEGAPNLNYAVVMTDNVAAALHTAINCTPADGLICACGSLFLVGELKAYLK